jgi:hypothetical protein
VVVPSPGRRPPPPPIPVTTIPDASCFCGFLAASYIFLCTFLSLFTVYLCKDVNYLGILGGL